MELKIALVGFKEYEEGLFIQQFKTVRKHTQGNWVYIQDAKDADYIIEYNDSYDKTLIYRVNEKSSFLEIDWPIRIFKLLEVLQNYETTAEPVEPIEAEFESVAPITEHEMGFFIKFISKLHDDFYFEYDNTCVFIDRKSNKIITNTPDFIELIKKVQSIKSLSCVKFYTHNRKHVSFKESSVFEFSIKSFMWSLFLSYKQPLNPEFLIKTNSFKIDAWPLSNGFESSSSLLRLAAAFTRSHTTIAQAATFAKVDEIEVIAFLQACEATSCVLNIARHGVVKDVNISSQSKDGLDNKTTGLLSKLRSKLGLTFGR